jgi:hypothetical protein
VFLYFFKVKLVTGGNSREGRSLAVIGSHVSGFIGCNICSTGSCKRKGENSTYAGRERISLLEHQPFLPSHIDQEAELEI